MHLTAYALHIPCKSCCHEFVFKLSSLLAAQHLALQVSSRACDLPVKLSRSYHSNVRKVCIAKPVLTVTFTL